MTIARTGFKKGADMDREGQTITEGRALAGKLGRVGLWTRQLDVQPAQQAREAIAELEALAGVRCGSGRCSAGRR